MMKFILPLSKNYNDDVEKINQPKLSCPCCKCRELQTTNTTTTNTILEFNKNSRARKNHHGKWIIYWHYLSILLWTTLLSQTVLINATTIMPQKQQFHSIKLEKNRPELDDPGGLDDDEFDKNKISLRVNPLLRHRRQSFQKSDHQMCHIWTKNSPKDLCNKGRWQRLKNLRELSVFSRDCSDETTNVQLGELFRLQWSKIKTESDLLSHTEHLKPGINGRDCLISSTKSDKCLACFNKIDKSFQIMDKAYDAFNKTLRRFDCMLAVDISSATRPFSPNGTCEDCKKWYRKWLLVQLLDLWIEPPCINWCYYAQLACPHLAPSRQVDYAGHPSFLCRDRKMSYTGEELQSSCTCFHPCDIQRIPLEPNGWWDKNKNRPSIKNGYDFFASSEHCWARKRRCEKEKLLKEMAIDSNRLPRDYSETNFLIDSLKNQKQKLSGKIFDDSPIELFNSLLGSWFYSNFEKFNQLEHRHQHRRYQRDIINTNSSSSCQLQKLSFILFMFLFLLKITFDFIQR